MRATIASANIAARAARFGLTQGLKAFDPPFPITAKTSASLARNIVEQRIANANKTLIERLLSRLVNANKCRLLIISELRLTTYKFGTDTRVPIIPRV